MRAMLAIGLTIIGVILLAALGMLLNWIPRPAWTNAHPRWFFALIAAVLLAVGVTTWLGSANVARSDGEPEVSFTSPDDGAFVTDTFTVEGTASGLDGNDLWLFVIGGNADVPGDVYYRYENTPLAIIDGKWSAIVTSLGESEDPRGETYTLGLVNGDSGCSQAIAELQPNAQGDIFLQLPLPRGCNPDIETSHVRKS